MLNRFGHLAEQAASSVSRRDFLGRLGNAALSLAASAGSVLALAGAAKPGDLCNFTGSTFYGVNNLVGGACGNRGKCTVVKVTYNDCYCRETGGGGRGGR